MGGKAVRERIEKALGVKDHSTTADRRYSYMTEECLAGCDWGPCMLINEKMHKCVKPEDVERILNDPANDKLDIPRSDLFDAPHARET
jgi:NADH:ubiquinone oxidoreductase subunit E